LIAQNLPEFDDWSRPLICGMQRLVAAVLLILMSPAYSRAQELPGVAGTAATVPDESKGIWERDHLTGDWRGLRANFERAGLTFDLQEQSELWGNFVGGLRRGTTYDGLTTASLELDLEKVVGWPSAKIFASGFEIHGRGPSNSLVGNLQLISNIEATPDIKLYDLWLEQELLGSHLSIRLGQEGANDEMMITKYGSIFLNSSFGFPGLPAADLPSGGPNYPMAAPFVRVRYASNPLSLTGAVYTADPAPPGTGDPQVRDAGGTTFRLNDHALSFAELAYSAPPAGLPGTYKFGTWYSSAPLLSVSDALGPSPASKPIPHDHAGGITLYGIIDQMIWKHPDGSDNGIGLFLQVMGTPTEFSLSNLFIEGGLNWKAPIPGRDSDVFGLGVAYLGISPFFQQFGDETLFTGLGSPVKSNETVVEATYLYTVAPCWKLQPDLQFVINPGAGTPSSGNRGSLINALAAGIRTTIKF
jgi:porin